MIYIVFLDEQNAGKSGCRLLPISLPYADESSLLEKHTTELSGFTRVITPFTKGRITLPVGTLVLKRPTSSVKYFTTSSRFQGMVAIATLGNLLRRAKKLTPDGRETTYFNLSSLKLIHTANNNLELFTGNSDCLDVILRKWETPNNTDFYQEIDNGFTSQLAFLKQIADKKGMPLVAFSQHKIEESISIYLAGVFPTLVSTILGLDPSIANFVYKEVGGNGNYYQRYIEKIDNVLKSPEHDIGLVNPSDSPAQQDTFPSVRLLNKIQTFAKGKSISAITSLQEKAHQVMQKLCTFYVLREIVELIAFKAENPSRVIATKYAKPYNKDIIISICLIGITKLGDLGNFLLAICGRDNGLQILATDTVPSAEDTCFINRFLSSGHEIGTSKPIFRQFLEFLSSTDELLHQYQTGGTSKGLSARPRINAPIESEFIVALCANEVFGKPPDAFKFKPYTSRSGPVIIRKLDTHCPGGGALGQLYSRVSSGVLEAPTRVGFYPT